MRTSLAPAAGEVYGLLSQRLHDVFEGEDGDEIVGEVRKLIERVDFKPLAGLGKFDLEVHGKLKALLGVAERASRSSTCELAVGAGTGSDQNLTVVPVAFAA